MSDDVNMDSFIQDTLRSMRRPRDSGFYSDQPPLISTSTKKFTTTSTPDVPAVVSTDCDLPAEGIKTSWYVSEAVPVGSMSLRVENGTVTAEDEVLHEYAGATVSGSEGNQVVYLQLSYPSAQEPCSGISVSCASSMPENTETEKYRRIASVIGASNETGLRLISSIQHLSDDVVLGEVNGDKKGDLLYWDDTNKYWAVLPAPSGSGVFVLTHNGTVPSWTATEECV
jgi:hypothetical protein